MFTKAQIRERFLRLFVMEHTDGSFWYVVLKNTEEDAGPCYCGQPANLRWVDVEDGPGSGTRICSNCLKDHLDYKEEDGELFYKPTGHTALEAWEGSKVDDHGNFLPGWGTDYSWWLFTPPGTQVNEIQGA